MYSTGVEEPTTLDGPFPGDEELRAFLQRARLTPTADRVGDVVEPGLRQDPHQWSWDAVPVVMGLGHFDHERARNEVRSPLRGQWLDGTISHVMHCNGSRKR